MAKPRVIVQAIISRRSLVKEFDKTRLEIARYLRTTGANTVIRELNKTVQGWEEAPTFEGTVTYLYAQTRIRLKVSAKGKGSTNWNRINSGTGPRILRSRKGLMSFPALHNAKTRPGGHYGGSGTKYGPMVWNRRSVGHYKPHRIEPRDFVGQVTQIVTPVLINHIELIVAKHM